MVRVLLYIGIVLITTNSYSQIESWYGVDKSRIGYRNTTFTFENAKPNEYEKWLSNPTSKYNGGSTEFSFDIFNKNTYFNMDLSFFTDALLDFVLPKNKSNWYRNEDYTISRFEFFPMRLAFGFPVTKYGAVYFGGQYQYCVQSIEYEDPNSDYRNTILYGNQRGLGTHLFFAKGPVLLNYSFMYDWISNIKVIKGKAITHDFSAYWNFKSWGLFVRYQHLYKNTYSGYLPEDRKALFKDNIDGDWSHQPAQYLQNSIISFGIFGSGIAGATMKATTTTIRKVEGGF